MLVELGVVEQRHAAVLEVLRDGAEVKEVALRFGVSRQTVHRWLRRYAQRGLAGWRISLRGLIRVRTRCRWRWRLWWWGCGGRIRGGVRARCCSGSRRGVWCRCRGGRRVSLSGSSWADPAAGETPEEVRLQRWERSRAMELWQMDVVGGVMLTGGEKASIVSGLDDHSRFVVSAHVVARATSRPTCDALSKAMRAWGVPDQVLTDNAKVFTGRFGPSAGGEVLFDRICRENGIRHLLTAPRSPTTTGKVERWHKTLRQEFLSGKVFESISDAQAQLDGWVRHYNFQRRHQGIGDVVPWERFRLVVEDRPGEPERAEPAPPPQAPNEATATRKVSRSGKISFAAQPYPVGVWLAGETVEVATDAGLVTISHRGVVVATHAQRHTPAKGARALRRKPRPLRSPRPRQPTVGQVVTRKVDSAGCVSFAGVSYRAGRAHRGRQVQVAVVDATVEITAGGEVLRVHPIRHDRSREHGAFANAGGRPSRINAA